MVENTVVVFVDVVANDVDVVIGVVVVSQVGNVTIIVINRQHLER